MRSRASSQAAAADAGAFFDDRADRYDRAYDGPGGYALRSRLEAALALLGSGPGEVLDAGMGPGRMLAELDRRGWTVSGVDASIEMVSAAANRLQNAASRLMHGRIEALPFPDESFDAVVATGVLEYSELERALSELSRVLRPGGLAVVSYPNPGNPYGLWKLRVWYRFVRTAKLLVRMPSPALPPGSAAVRPDEFLGLLATVGFQPECVQHAAFLVVPSPLDELFPRVADRLGHRVEGSRSRLARIVAGQIVYAARKP